MCLQIKIGVFWSNKFRKPFLFMIKLMWVQFPWFQNLDLLWVNLFDASVDHMGINFTQKHIMILLTTILSFWVGHDWMSVNVLVELSFISLIIWSCHYQTSFYFIILLLCFLSSLLDFFWTQFWLSLLLFWFCLWSTSSIWTCLLNFFNDSLSLSKWCKAQKYT